MFDKTKLSGVYLTTEFENALFKGDFLWLKKHADAQASSAFFFFTGGTTDEFFNKLKYLDSKNCPQYIISYLKYSRDIGSAWTIFKET